MAKANLATYVGFCVLLAFIGSTEARAPARVNVGYFQIDFQDPEINDRVSRLDANTTAWEKFYEATRKYWSSNLKNGSFQSEDVEEATIREYADTNGVNGTDFNSLLQQAKDNLATEKRRFNNNAEVLWREAKIDLSDKILTEAEEEFVVLDHANLAAYAGVGAPVDCAAHIDTILGTMSEWEKAGMGAASTLMALLPTFLAFGNLFVPRSSEAFATSWLVGVGAALFSLGLPVRSLSCIKRKQVLELATLDKDTLDTIGALGEEKADKTANTVESKQALAALREWTQEASPRKDTREFVRIRRAVDQYAERWHWWHIPAVLVAAAQGCIFGYAIEPLLKAAGIPKFIFACAGVNWTGLYLSVSAIVNAVFRLFLWQLCDHELVSLYHLSETAKAELDKIKDDDACTTATQLPPLYPPLISKFHRTRGRIINRFLQSYRPYRQEHPQSVSRLPFRAQLANIGSTLKNSLNLLKSGFANTSAAPRYRPLIVLIHLSTQGRPQLRTLFTGFCEAALLLALTFFFASQWGGNLYLTAIALALLLLFITVGRALAIIYVWFSARTWGLHSINCDEQGEILGCLRILCSMEGVLVTVNGAHYYDGHRLDYGPRFEEWRRKYSAGKFDQPTPTTTRPGTSQIKVQTKGHGGYIV